MKMVTQPKTDLLALLAQDFSFKGETSHPMHNTHAFAAKFPPQLPRVFIESLTKPGDIVLDPMCGSGTTVVEASHLGRIGIGIDMDTGCKSIAGKDVCPGASFGSAYHQSSG